jgi:GNAT superfamily N-acetyltransferase
LKFGIFYELQLPRPWHEDAEYELLNHALDQIEVADRLGYDYAWEVEHHFLEEYSHSSAPEVFLGAASQRTKNIRLGHGIVQVTTNHPARIAERVSTLDLLSHGRVELGLGEGSTTTELHPFDRDRGAKSVAQRPETPRDPDGESAASDRGTKSVAQRPETSRDPGEAGTVILRGDDAFSPHELAAIRRMLGDAFAGDFDDTDWDHTFGGWRAVVWDGDVPVAHAAVFGRAVEVGGRALEVGYVEGVGTAPARQRQGLGSAVMGAIGDVIQARFDLGVLGTGEHGFYERLGWERWQGPSYVRRRDRLARTAEDDDGLMVLRTPRSGDVDLTAPIVCDERAGDDW